MNIKIFCRCSLFPSWSGKGHIGTPVQDADKSLARHTSWCFFLMVRIFLFMLVLLYIYINSTNFPPIMIINRIYETQNLLSLQLVSFLVGLRTYQHLCMTYRGADKALARTTSHVFCLMVRIFCLMPVFLYIYIYIYIVLIFLQL